MDAYVQIDVKDLSNLYEQQGRMPSRRIVRFAIRLPHGFDLLRQNICHTRFHYKNKLIYFT